MAYTTINKSSDFFNTVLYTGNATDNRAITGVGFQPDFTWIKERNGTPPHILQDAVRGADYQIYSNSTDAQTNDNNKVKSFNADGFTIGTGTWVNTNSDTYVSWNWKAGGGQGSSNTTGSINTTYTSVSTTSGVSISKYTGNDTSGATIGHGLGVAPKMIMIKQLTTSNYNWSVGHASIGFDKYLKLNEGDAAENATGGNNYFNSTAPSSTLITLGNAAGVNASSQDYICYAFAEKTGYSKIGSYLGNGNADGTFVYTGFKPKLIIAKNTNDTANWWMYDNKRLGYNVLNYGLHPNLTNVEWTDQNIDLLSNGFKMRSTNNTTNGSGDTFIYMAFGQTLVGSNNVPCTAR